MTAPQRLMPNLSGVPEITEVVEEMKGQAWKEFRERHNDWGRDLVFIWGGDWEALDSMS